MIALVHRSFQLTVTTSSVPWLPWGAAAFARARDEQKPVLLSIHASWCEWCDTMDRTTYADSEVVSSIRASFVPVRVDVDARPDVSERYTLGGWPTVAFLTAGGEIVGGGTFVAVEKMPALLAQVARAFADRCEQFVRQPDPDSNAHATAELPARTPEELRREVFAAFDAEHGGFGAEPKFPHAGPVHLALDLYRESGEQEMRDVAVRTLDAMGWGGLYDEVDGGFFRCAASRAWQLPRHEKLLGVNAALLSLYVDAADTLQLARFGERAEDVLRYLQTWLADVTDGGWFASQRADATYYNSSSRDERRSRIPPPVDERLFSDVNGATVSAALQAARAMADEGLRDFAIKSLERVVLAAYRPGAGVAHLAGHGEHACRLLEDQIAMATAHLDAFDATGNIVYEMMAEELAHFALRTMWDEAGGGFFDRERAPEAGDAEAIGLLRRPLKPFAVNCQAARMLRRVAATSGDSQFATYADATLAALAATAAAQGPLAAEYLLALRHLKRG